MMTINVSRRSRTLAAGAVSTGLVISGLAVAPVSATSGVTAETVSATLGGEPVFDGLRATPGDGPAENLEVTDRAGRECWSTSIDDDILYIYGDVDNEFIFDGTNLVGVTADYFDAAAGRFTISYESSSSTFEEAETVELTGSNEWKQHTFFLDDAKFADGMNSPDLEPADFRVAVWAPSFGFSEADVCFARVEVEQNPDVPPPPLEIGQTTLGNVFIGDQEPRFVINTHAPQFSWTVRDTNGLVVAEGVGRAQAGQNELVLRDLTDLGYFELTVSTPSSEDQPGEIRTTSFARLSEPPEPENNLDSPFAVAVHYGQCCGNAWDPKTIPLLQAMGAAHARDNHYWNEVETSKGEYAFGQHETFMTALSERGVNPLMLAAYANPLYDGGHTVHTPEGYEAWANYVQAILRHYGEDIKELEIYNEYNISVFSNGPCEVDPVCFAEMMKVSYPAAKAENPDVTVVMGGTSGIPMDWLDEVFAQGALDYMDAVSVHPYRTPRAPEGLEDEIDALDRLIRDHNGGEPKPIYITELGWPSSGGVRGVDEATQAPYLVRSYALALGAGVQRYAWYDFINDGTDPSEPEHNFGLIRAANDEMGAYTPKPGYVAYAVMTRQLTGTEFASRDRTPDGVYSYVFDGGTRPVRVMWSPQPKQVTVHTDSPVTLVDTFGGETTYRPHAGKVSLTLDGSPIYLRGQVDHITSGSAVTIEAPAQVAVGDQVPVTVSVDGTSLREPTPVQFLIDGRTTPVTVVAKPGEVTSRTVSVPGSEQTGARKIVADVRVHGSLSGRLATVVDVRDAVELTDVVPFIVDITPLRQELRVGILNNSVERPVTVDRVDWSVGEQSGTRAVGTAIAPGGTGTIAVPLPEPADLFATYPTTAKVHLDGVDQPLVMEREVTFSPMLPRGDEHLAEPLDLERHGKVVEGATAGGTVAMSWDADALYLSARIEDDTFHQSDTAGEMWRGDGIQFALADDPPAPGRFQQSYEYGIALTPDGPQTFRWNAPDGVSTGLVGDAELIVRRDESSEVTSYELALPWSQLVGIDPDDDLLALSLLVNDNDGSGRGWIEWGGGIGGSKDTSLFRNAQIIR